MDIENNNEKNQEETTQQEGSQKEVRRTPRPRIHTAQRATFERQDYRRHDNEEGGFRPEGFGAALHEGSSSREEYRPRTSYSGGYRPRQEGGYQPRQNQEGGYQSRQGGYQPRQGGYRPRQEGGYQPRQNQEGGYQPRQGGYQSRQNQEGGYQPRQGGYQSRQNQEGGYQPRQGGYQSRQGGYQQRQGGYQSRQGQGGYQQRPYGNKSYSPYKKPYQQRTPDYDPNAKYSMKKRIEYKEANYDPNEPLRLNKFLANAGVCSRREADEFIQAGVVSVNGEVVTELGTKVLRTDVIKFHDQTINIEKKVYVLLNKPKDYVTTSDDPQQRKTVMDLVKNACPERIYPVGRLDRNTTGVLLLTNDGDLASKLTHPKYLKKKIYHVYLDKNVTAHDLQQIADGVQLEDGEIKADDVQYASPTDKKQVGIEIHSGKNRIVRRIFEALGYRVQKLDRVQFAGLTKKNLRRGDWRYLTEEEVDRLRMGAYE